MSHKGTQVHDTTRDSVELGKHAANFVPLTPLSFLQRAARVYPDQISVVHGDLRHTWRQTEQRCRQLAAALVAQGVQRGDVVAIMAPNIPALYESHFGVPMAGAVLLALNTRLDVETTAYILNHSKAKVLFYDREYARLVSEVCNRLETPVLLVDIHDSQFPVDNPALTVLEYEDFLAGAPDGFEPVWPLDEWDSISLNYTSGTTGRPKGAVYSHRSAYLNAMGNAVSSGLQINSVYLWTLPMFHCNGWCFPWTMALLAGTNVCLRKVEPKAIFTAIRNHKVRYFCGAPVVLNMMANAPQEDQFVPDWPLLALTGGAAPAAALIANMEKLNIEVEHLYGLTETLGPSVVCSWHEQWNGLPLQERADLKSRIGVIKHTMEDAMAVDPQTKQTVPPDGQTVGELLLRGNTVMKGYLHDPGATAQAFDGGWFHTGDLVVVHPDGYFQVKDRLKDIVISGGENISTIELEGVLYRHPAVLEAAVVAMPDPKWGETPCAFVTLKQGQSATEQDIVSFCRQHLAGFKVPRKIVFSELPKTSTGKVQKYVLRKQAQDMACSGRIT